MPEHDIGPVLDERDLETLTVRAKELAKLMFVIYISDESPEDHPNLKMSQDGQILLITSDLYIEIIDKIRPASVRYMLLKHLLKNG